MSGDYKYDIHLRAEEIASERYGADFYDLTPDQRHEVYSEAMAAWSDDLASRGDHLRKSRMEGGF